MIDNVVPVHIWPSIMKQSTSKLNWSEQKASKSSQAGEHVCSVKDSAAKAKSIATLQFAVENVSFSCAENLAVCYQEQFPNSCIAKKNVTTGPTKMSYLVSYGLGHTSQSDGYQRNSGMAFLFHTAISWNSNYSDKK